jgi:hypothetical protein
MPTCPKGHLSGSVDWCDRCGLEIGGAAAPPTASAATLDEERFDERCPYDGTPRTGRFCEVDGYDFELGAGRSAPQRPTETREPVTAAAAPPPPISGRTGPGWLAEVIADRDYYERVVAQAGSDAASFPFPPYAPQRRVPLTGEQVRIGRRSVSKGTTPEIDLSEPPADPGVSHTHALLLARPDDRWSLVDPGSTNGTTVNGGDEPVRVNVEVPLGDGDRVHVGVWTTIILRRSQ